MTGKALSLTGCNYAALLEKPFELDDVLQTIARLLPPTRLHNQPSTG